MARHHVTVFKPYPFTPGQRIYIDGGRRAGDWEVVGVTERKVKLRCPLSGREFEWDRFCYAADEVPDSEWPRPE